MKYALPALIAVCISGAVVASAIAPRPNSVVQWGIPGDVPVAGDFDGDHIGDIAVYRPSSGMWFIIQSSFNFNAHPSRALCVQWGLPGDVPMPSDYTGDGRTDLAVYRPSNGVWYFRQSEPKDHLPACALGH